MPAWEWVGYGDDGVQFGRGLADSKAELLGERQSVLLTRLRPVRPGRLRPLAPARLAQLTRLMAIMAASGLPFPVMLEQLLSQAGTRLERDLLAALATDLRAGHSLSQTFARRKVFSPLYLAVLRACEQGGDRRELLALLAETLESGNAFVRHLTGATVYPAILLLSGLAALYLMTVLVVPSMRAVLGDGADLPALTLYLFALADGLGSWTPGYGTLSLLVALLLFGGRVRASAQRFLELLPVVREMHLARAAAVLQLLLRGQVPLTDALQIASGVAGEFLAKALRRVAGRVTGGSELSTALAADPALPALWGRLSKAGEMSGDYCPCFEMLSTLHGESLQRQTALITRIAEPVMVLLVGAFMTAVLLGLYLPVLQAGTAF